MDIINQNGVNDAIVRLVAQHMGVSDKHFPVVLDRAVNAVQADAAHAKLEEYRQKGWKYPSPSWETDVTGENDIHACTVARRLIASQQLPEYVLEAINGYELLVYLDATWTKGPEMSFVLTLAHELRHAWQYFNEPVVFHSQTALSWVMPPQLTPCELDAEKAAKRELAEMYGDSALRAYLDAELARCKPEHREAIGLLAALDHNSDPEMCAKTVALLEHHAAEIRKLQRENNFVMPGIRELSDVLCGRSNVQLRR
jgi:hypothetical protein